MASCLAHLPCQLPGTKESHLDSQTRVLLTAKLAVKLAPKLRCPWGRHLPCSWKSCRWQPGKPIPDAHRKTNFPRIPWKRHAWSYQVSLPLGHMFANTCLRGYCLPRWQWDNANICKSVGMHVRLEAPVCRAAWLRCCSVLCQRREASRHGAKLQSVFLAGTLKHLIWTLFRWRLAKYFLKVAKKASGTLGLTEAVVGFFKNTQGVGNRKAVLKPKQATDKSLRKHPSKARNPQLKRTMKKVFWLHLSSQLLMVAGHGWQLQLGLGLLLASCEVGIFPNTDIAGLTLQRMLVWANGGTWKIDPDQRPVCIAEPCRVWRWHLLRRKNVVKWSQNCPNFFGGGRLGLDLGGHSVSRVPSMASNNALFASAMLFF